VSRDYGIDLGCIRTTVVSAELVAKADVILVMELGPHSAAPCEVSGCWTKKRFSLDILRRKSRDRHTGP